MENEQSCYFGFQVGMATGIALFFTPARRPSGMNSIQSPNPFIPFTQRNNIVNHTIYFPISLMSMDLDTGYEGGLCDNDMVRRRWQVPVAASPVNTNVFTHDVASHEKGSRSSGDDNNTVRARVGIFGFGTTSTRGALLEGFSGCSPGATPVSFCHSFAVTYLLLSKRPPFRLLLGFRAVSLARLLGATFFVPPLYLFTIDAQTKQEGSTN
jgi:hypothetical protein